MCSQSSDQMCNISFASNESSHAVKIVPEGKGSVHVCNLMQGYHNGD